MTMPTFDLLNRSAETLFGFAYNDRDGLRRDALVESADLLRNAAHQIHELQSLIDDAPHDSGCELDRPEAEIRPKNKCTCWKADAL